MASGRHLLPNVAAMQRSYATTSAHAAKMVGDDVPSTAASCILPTSLSGFEQVLSGNVRPALPYSHTLQFPHPPHTPQMSRYNCMPLSGSLPQGMLVL